MTYTLLPRQDQLVKAAYLLHILESEVPESTQTALWRVLRAHVPLKHDAEQAVLDIKDELALELRGDRT